MVDQTDAQGNKINYSQIGNWADGTPRYSATQTLSPGSQQLFNTGQQTSQNLANLAQQQSGRLSGLLNKELDFSGLPSAGTVSSTPQLQTSLGTNDFSGDRQRVEDALFTRLNPQTDRDRQNLETSLVNRGIRPGSSAYQQEMGTFNQGLNDQRTSILLNAGQEQNRMQQLALNAGNFGNSALQQQYANSGNQFNQQNATRSNALNELMTQRAQPLNEILALAGQGQVSQPTFTNTPQTGVAGTDVAGITANGYNQQMAQYNSGQSTLGGLFSAGASLIPLLSDRRSKENIKRIGTAFNGLAIYSYTYRGENTYHIGFMADEVAKLHPDAVERGEDGLDRVFYEKAVA